MSAITLEKKDDGTYIANLQFRNIEKGSGLYLVFAHKLYRMWNDMCNYTNGEHGLIAQINKWAEENDISGDDWKYTQYTNSQYKELLDELCDREEYQFDMQLGNKLKMHCIMDPNNAGAFDVEILVE